MVLAPALGVIGFLLLWQSLVRVIDAASLPAPWDVLRHAGAVLGEFSGHVTKGLGLSVGQALNLRLPLQLWGSVFVLALMGSVATALIAVAERAVLRRRSPPER